MLFAAINKEKRVIRGFYCIIDVLLFTAIDKEKRVIRGFYCIADVLLFTAIPGFTCTRDCCGPVLLIFVSTPWRG